MIGPAPVCLTCAHLHETEVGFFCDAFPDGEGIPAPILVGGDPHDAPFEGDHGIQYEEA